MQKEEYALWLHTVPGIGNKTIDRLLQYAGTEEAIYHLKKEEREKLLNKTQQKQFLEWKDRKDPAYLWQALKRKQVCFVTRFMEAYPKRLLQIPDAPYALYFKGRLPQDQERSVAIVGARSCSEYGRQMAEWFGRELAQAGIQIVSGLARGIDGIGQQSAMRAGGSSFGVLGCGIDICYPPENAGIYQQCIRTGGVLSEYPPGRQPGAGLFPQRNRIISGLADSLIVIEARAKSGTLITVDMALEQGREVFALPGRATDTLSEGCNRLLQQGAALVCSPQEVLHALYAQGSTVQREQRIEPCFENAKKRLLWHVLDEYPKPLTELYEHLRERTGMSLQELIELLTELMLEGYIGEKGKSYYYRRKY